MEGNLKGARHSLRPQSVASNGISNRQPMNQRSRSSLASISSPNETPGHSRAASETSAPSPAPVATLPRPPAFQKRASSALGSFAGGLSALGPSASLRGVRSQEVMRESRLQTWMLDESTHVSPHDIPRSLSSNGHHHQPVLQRSRTPSTEIGLKRSSIDIRNQMNEIRERISSIKERARETSGRRLSGMSLHSPSPSIISEQKYTSDPLKSPSASSTSGSGTRTGTGTQTVSPSQASPLTQTRPAAAAVIADYAESSYEDAEETLDDLEGGLVTGSSPTNHFGIYDDEEPEEGEWEDDEEGEEEEDDEEDEQDYDDDDDEDHETEAMDSDLDDFQSLSGHTEYFESEQVVAERHEDRVDAFDYEHFFLHSAMGTYSRERRDSLSSEDSVETTRPVSPRRLATAQEDGNEAEHSSEEEDPSNPSNRSSVATLRTRSQSMESMNSIATFQTATEGYNGEDTANEGVFDDDQDPVAHLVLVSAPHPQVEAARTPRNLSPSKTRSSTQFISNGLASPPLELPPSPPSDLVRSMSSAAPKRKSRPTSALISSFIGLDSLSVPAETVASDRALVESVVQALQKCCLQLQRAGPDDNRDMWRDKLLEAKKLLNGPGAL
jgi:hypothetical protein